MTLAVLGPPPPRLAPVAAANPLFCRPMTPVLTPAAGYAMEKKSSIIGIGLTIANTPVELREKMAVPEAEWPRVCVLRH